MFYPFLTRNIMMAFLVILFLATGCSWFQSDPDKLPPITMEGKNTFGCLLNGEVWKPGPKGKLFGIPILNLYYDPTYKNGTIGIYARKDIGDEFQSMSFGTANLLDETISPLTAPDQLHFTSTIESMKCEYSSSDIIFQQGELIILEINTEDRFIAGTFEFTLATAECDTIRVTEGRFDLRF